jgi:hypothetical protein
LADLAQTGRLPNGPTREHNPVMKPGAVLVACAAWVLLAAGLPSPVAAADIYRWVDENGQTHLSDKVPDRYRNSAVKVDPGATDVSPEQQRQAQERNARIKAAGDAGAQRQAEEDAAAGRTAPVPPAPAIQPQPAPSRDANCDELFRRYRASQECFAPYRMANGAMRPEAFILCGPGEPDPSAQCGAQVNPD